MSDESAAAIRQERTDWVTKHRDVYLSSGGAKGHVMDVSDVGGHAFTTHCLLRVKGRKTGRIQIAPLIYADVGGEIVVVASKGGADRNPEWYLNLIGAPEVDVQIATQAWRATWREPEGDERHKVWDFMSHAYPPYITYQKSTTRHIPVIMLTPVTAIDVFVEPEGQSS